MHAQPRGRSMHAAHAVAPPIAPACNLAWRACTVRRTGTQQLRFPSGHRNNVFQARMLPHSGGSRLITCAADGQVRA